MSAAKKGLGKGLDALISSAGAGAAGEDMPADASAGVIEVDINKVEPNKDQPRKHFDSEALAELAESLKDYGVIQPLIVKKEDGYFSIIAGERRWRAARMAGLRTVPVMVKDYSDADALQIALIENLQRKDLNPVEEALGYKKLATDFFYTQEAIAAKMGKSRNSVTNALSLLNLDERVQKLLAAGKLSAAHGRQLLAVKDGDAQFELAEHLAEEGTGVREAEKMIKRFLEDADKKTQAITPPKSAFGHVESELRQLFGTRVTIRDGKSKGKIEIEYYSPDELDRLIGLFKKL